MLDQGILIERLKEIKKQLDESIDSFRENQKKIIKMLKEILDKRLYECEASSFDEFLEINLYAERLGFSNHTIKKKIRAHSIKKELGLTDFQFDNIGENKTIMLYDAGVRSLKKYTDNKNKIKGIAA